MHKSGFVNIIGNPNAGKSTLLNSLLGEQLSIITPKAQTTRHRIAGMLNHENYQVVFSDTPGVIEPVYALQQSMMDYVNSIFEDADVLIYITTPDGKPLRNAEVMQALKAVDTPLIILINKIDLCDQKTIEQLVDKWQSEFPEAEIIPGSALHEFGTDVLLERILVKLPESPPYFDKESLSDRSERFFTAEMVREQIFLNYDKEVPYASQVEVDEFKEADDIIRIRATIYVERDNQKSIIIGAGGKMIKKTGTAARKRLEAFFKKKVFLDLFVKVRKDWRKNDAELRRFGYGN